MNRYTYTPSTLSFQTLKIGRLKCLQQIVVNAGDSISLSMGQVARLSPLRRSQIAEPECHIAAFYTPMRHVYPNWVEYITEGIDEGQNLDTIAGTSANNIGAGGLEFLGQSLTPEPMAAHLLRPYNQIYRRYYRYPNNSNTLANGNTDIGVVPDDAIQAGSSKYGYRCCHLPNVWNSALQSFDLNDADRNVAITNNKLDITKLNQQRARYSSEMAREFFASTDRYKDILRLVYDTGQINIDADQRPELLTHNENYIGGYDIDATDTNSIGKAVSKGQKTGTFGFPKKFFPEHGVITIVALIRYPTFTTSEKSPLMEANLPYKIFGGDPAIIGNEPPVEINAIEWIGYANVANQINSKVQGVIPYGQEWRTLPEALIDNSFIDLQGFPFVKLWEEQDPYYIDSEIYDSIFQSPGQLGHAQISAKLNWDIERVVPYPMSSIMAGGKK